MKAAVKKDGVLIPKRLLGNAQAVEIHKEKGRIVVQPLGTEDPILSLGANPGHSGLSNLAEDHDQYLYGNDA